MSGHAVPGSLRGRLQPATSPSPWQLQANVGAILLNTSVISCASATVCYATAETESQTTSPFLVSVNAGQSWLVRAAPANQFLLDGLACPAVSTCFLASVELSGGQEIFLTHNGGTSWTEQQIPAHLAIDDISCRSLLDCIAVGVSTSGAIAVVTTNGGDTWTSHEGPSKGSFGSVTCPSATECDAVGESGTGDALVAMSTDGGSAWHSAALTATSGALDGVACPSTSECVAVGGRQENTGVFSIGFATYDSGTKWGAVAFPSRTGPLIGVACPTASECVGADEDPLVGALLQGSGTAALLSSNRGRAWHSVALPDVGPIGNVACPTTSTCLTSDTSSGSTDRLLRTMNAGSSWTTATEPAGSLLQGMSCSSTTACAAVGESDTEAVTETTTNGSSWQANPVPNFVALTDVSCVAATTDCYAIGTNAAGNPVFAISPNSGVNWRAGNAFGSIDELDGLDCPATGVCYLAVSSSSGATTLEETTSGGGTGTWTSMSVPNGSDQEGAHLSCPSTTECIVAELTGEITTTTDSGASWAVATMPGGVSEIQAISCATTTTCVAMAGTTNNAVETLISTDTGGTFEAGDILPSTFFPSSLACSNASSCELLGSFEASGPGSFTTSNAGRAWTSQTGPSQLGANSEWGPLACPSAGLCEADGVASTGDGEIFRLG